MAIDKIVLEFQAETTKLKKELEDLKGRLGNVETAAKDAGKKTGKAFDDVGKNANGLKDTIKNLGQQIAAAFAAREIIRFTKQTIDAASDLNETVSKSQQIFGDASKAVEDFASNSAKQFGQSKQQAIDAAASFGVFGKAAGLTGEDLSTFSTDLVALSADLASFGNTTPEEAALALGAALRGEAEPIRRFGVLLDDATLKQEALAMGLIKTTKGALTPQQKVLAANAVILKQTADAQGDFARTSDGVANQQRILEASFKDLQTEIGQKLLPTFNSALTSLNEFLGDLDAEDVMSFAKAIGFAATAFGAFKLGSLIKDMGGLTGMLKATTGGVQGLSKAVMSNPLGLLATAAAALIAYGPDLYDMFAGVTELQNEMVEASDKATENLRKEQAELNLVADALTRTNPGGEQRAKLLERFNQLSPVAIKDLKDEKKFTEQLNGALSKANESFALRIKLRGAEAAASVASQKQIDVQAKIIEAEQKLLMEGFTEAQIKARQGSGALSRFTQIALTLGGQGAAAAAMNEFTELIRLDEQFNEASKALEIYTNLATEAKNETEKGTSVIKENTEAEKENTKGKEKTKTAIELVTEEISKLNTEAELLAFKGDWIGAKKKTEQANLLQNQLDGLKKTIEEFNSEVNIQRPEILPMKPADTGTDTSLPELPIPDAMSIKVNLDVDEESAENAVVSIQAIHEAASNVAGGLSTLQSNFGQMVGAFAQISGENAEYVKALSVIQVQIQMAAAIAAAIAGATSSAATTGPGAPFVLAGYIASMVGAVVSAFAQTTQLLSAEVPKPSFYDGTAYLQRGGNPKGKDTIPVMAHEGEAIIPTRNNLQYPGLAKSWIEGNLDGYINNNFVRPALMEQQKQAEEDFADRLAASMALQMSSNFDDYRLHRDLKEQTAVLRFGFETMKINRKKIRGGR
jgi:hypothetical protein